MRKVSSIAVVFCILVVAVAVVWTTPEVAASKPPSFIEVGQTYDFHASDAMLTGEVLEIGRDGWLRIREKSSGKIGWVNLSHIWGIKQP